MKHGEPLYQLLIKPDGSCRLSIARNEEVNVSRRQVRIEWAAADGRARIKNISSNVPFSLGNGRPVKPGTEVMVELPVLLKFGKRSVRLEDPSAKGAGGPIQSLSEPTLVPAGLNRDARSWERSTCIRAARSRPSPWSAGSRGPWRSCRVRPATPSSFRRPPRPPSSPSLWTRDELWFEISRASGRPWPFTPSRLSRGIVTTRQVAWC